jgi:hypothetical protein
VSDRRRGRRIHRRAALLASVGLAVVVSGCSGGSDEVHIMLPSSLAVPTTAADAASTSSATSPPTSMVIPADGSPGLSGLRAELAQPACTEGVVDVAIAFELAPEPPVRIVTAFVDGSTTAAGSAGGDAEAITAAAVPCDGNTHLILVIATSQGGQSTTQSVSVRTPPPG